MAIYQPKMTPRELSEKKEREEKQKKRKGKPIYAYIPTRLYRKVEEYCEETGASKTHVITAALEDYLSKDEVKAFLKKNRKFNKQGKKYRGYKAGRELPGLWIADK